MLGLHFECTSLMNIIGAESALNVSSARKGDEMTEVVTSFAAIPQLNLLAARQQGFSIDRTNAFDGTDVDATAAQSSTPHVAPSPQAETAGHHESTEQKQADQSARNNSGPSRARIEIRSLDIGLTPAEVVGTLDVLQRFDSNGDGRVDILEADRASLVREKRTTFAGLAAAPKLAQAASVAAPAPEIEIPGAPRKIFTPAETAEVGTPKKLYADAAAQGVASGVADVPKKFYGQGAEVVVGTTVAAATAEAPAKIHDKVVVQDRVITEAGTGETKLYDKVAQANTDQNPDTSGGNGQLYERAQREAAIAHENKKTVVVEVAAYANTAATTDTATPAAATTVVTA